MTRAVSSAALAALAVLILATFPASVGLVSTPGIVSAAPLQQTVVDICDRTPEVEAAILAKLPEGTTCEAVTDVQLGAITPSISVKGYSEPELLRSDFAGLTGLTEIFVEYSPALKRVPADAFDELTKSHVTNVGMGWNGIEALESGVFDGFTNIQRVYLWDNAIKVLDADIFDGLSTLEELYLPYNAIEALDADIFDGLTRLEHLHLENNSLTTLDADIFDGLSNLEELFLFGNSITSLHAEIFDGLSSLRFLRLDSTGITALDADIFGGLSSLLHLQLNHTGITELDENIFNGLSNLQELWLQDTGITALDADIFDGLSSLERLYLNGNSLTTLEPELFDPLDDSLTWLWLRDAGLTSLHVDIFDGLTGLEILTLSGNSLTALPANVFQGLAALTILTLYDNSLTTLETELFDPLDDSLTRLFLNGNAITSLDEDIFDGLGGLATLNLDENDLSALTAGVFTDLDDSLKTLYLRDNDLTALPANIFAGLTGLERLDLSCNDLTALELTRFSPFAATLKYLDVGVNSFTTAPVDATVRGTLTNTDLVLNLTGTAPCLSATDTGLSALTVSHGTLTPPFVAPGGILYRVTVAHDVDAVTIKPTARHPRATIEDVDPGIAGGPPSWDTDSEADGIQFNPIHGSPFKGNHPTWKVVAPDKEASRTYQLYITREDPPATIAWLSNLTMDGITLTPEFTSRTFAYTATGTTLARTKVTPVLSDSDASYVIRLGNTVDEDGTVDLAVGSNVITIEVTAEDGTTTQTYTATVTRVAVTPTPGSTPTPTPSPTPTATPEPTATPTAGPTPTLPTVSIEDATASEGDGHIVFTVRLSGVAAGDVEVSVSPLLSNRRGSVSNADISFSGSNVTIPAGQLTTTVRVPIIDDDVEEDTETFRVLLGGPSGSTEGPGLTHAELGETFATGTIHDNDGATVRNAAPVFPSG